MLVNEPVLAACAVSTDASLFVSLNNSATLCPLAVHVPANSFVARSKPLPAAFPWHVPASGPRIFNAPAFAAWTLDMLANTLLARNKPLPAAFPWHVPASGFVTCNVPLFAACAAQEFATSATRDKSNP